MSIKFWIFLSYVITNTDYKKNKKVYLAGDFNFDLLKVNRHDETSVFFNKYLSSRVRYVYGLNFFEKALLSLILTFKKPVATEQSRKDYYSKIKSKTSIIPPINDEDILNLAKELLPLSFREIYKKRASFSKCKGKIILRIISGRKFF